MSALSLAVEALGGRILDYFRFQEAAGAATVASTVSARTLARTSATLGSGSIVPTDSGGKSVLLDGVDDFFVGALADAYKLNNLGIAAIYEVPNPVPASGSGLICGITPKGAHADGRGVWVWIDWAARRFKWSKGIASGSWVTHTHDLDLTSGAGWKLLFFFEAGTATEKMYMTLVNTEFGYGPWSEMGPAQVVASNSTAISWADNAGSSNPRAARLWVGGSNNGGTDPDVAEAYWLKGRLSELIIYDPVTSGGIGPARMTTLKNAAGDTGAPTQRKSFRSCPFSSVSTWTVPLDALQIEADDTVLVTVSAWNPGGEAVAAPTLPTNWSRMGSPGEYIVTDGTAKHYSGQFRRQISGSIPTDVQFVFSSAQTGVALVQVYPALAAAPTGTGAAQGHTNVPNPPSHNAGSVAERLYLAMVTGTNETSGAQTIPSGYGGLSINPRVRWATNPHVNLCHKTATSQTEDPGVWIRPAFEYSVAWTLALPLLVPVTVVVPGSVTITDTAGNTRVFEITVAPNQKKLKIATTGDADAEFDIFVRKGSFPTTTTYDFAFEDQVGSKKYQLNVTPGTWYVMIIAGPAGYQDMDLGFSEPKGGGRLRELRQIRALNRIRG